MSQIFLTMAMSLDGFVTGPDDNAENPAGTNGMRLMNWLDGGSRARCGRRSRIPTQASQQPAGVRRGHGDRGRDHREADR